MIKAKVPHAKIMAIVKANAYGHGVISVSKRLEGHVDAFGVASIYEALSLRQAGIKSPISLLEGVFSPKELTLASKQGFTVIFHSNHQLGWLTQIKLTDKLHAWLKLDTGMSRLGFTPKSAVQAMRTLSENSSIIQPVGIMSNFACASEPAHSMNAKQISIFRTFVQKYQGEKSFCNSAAIIAFPDMHYDWVRPGLALYGISPLAGHQASFLGLKPVMTFQTEIIAIRNLKSGDNVGYCPEFMCSEDMPVGIAAVGYRDGYPVAMHRDGVVLINGMRCPLVGRVMMDMIAIDLRLCVDAKIGDKVTLWGEGLAIEEVATCSYLSYALLTGVHDNRVVFEWRED